MNRTCVLVLAAFLSIAVGDFALAADVRDGNFGAAASETAKTTPSKRNSYPFSGELESHDVKSITLKGKKKPRVLLLSLETRILRNGSIAKLQSAVPGERISGSVRKNAEGKEEALTVNLKGPKPDAK